MSLTETLWRTGDDARWFIVPDDTPRSPGSLMIHAPAGDLASVDPAWVQRYEVTEAEGRAWAQEEFGHVLDELRRQIDEKLIAGRRAVDSAKRTPVSPDSAVTPDAVPALFDLARKLPGVILESLSRDTTRIDDAKARMASLKQRLAEAGIDLNQGLTDFPERLAGLRSDFERERRGGKMGGTSEEP